MSITAIAGHTLLKLVGRHVIHELSKYGLAGIHPSLSKHSCPQRRASSLTIRVGIQIEKIKIARTLLIPSYLYAVKKI
jgi:hypothetical protein